MRVLVLIVQLFEFRGVAGDTHQSGTLFLPALSNW